MLYRKLLKFAYDNNCYDTSTWDGFNYHCYIYLDYPDGKFHVGGTCVYKSAEVWFSSYVSAERAIKEIVEPFVKEHPDFVW